ncbi:GEVED domain-containing protein [Photobacterium leiognathi]|uniref:GEVED domain-containing protein n=1 Tax=Photobacterium leiognathi TaxID=553611 RepID=UPI002980AD8C|nr:GEVED domain-containing protein [Photobacterium leiognathi]
MNKQILFFYKLFIKALCIYCISFNSYAEQPRVISNSGFSDGVFQNCAPVGKYYCMRVFAGKNGDNYLNAGGGCRVFNGSSTFFMGDVVVQKGTIRTLNADDKATYYFPNGITETINGGHTAGGNCETGRNTQRTVNRDVIPLGTTFTVASDVLVGGGGEAWGQMDVYFEPYLQDYGDAPDASNGVGAGNYRTRLGDNGPSHRALKSEYTVYLGVNIPDDDDDGLQNADATADDNNAGSTFYGVAGDDEDGVTYPSVRFVDTTYSITADATNTSGSDAYLYAWFDFDNSGTFDVDELITNGTGPGGAFIVPTGTNNQTQTLTWNFLADLTANGYYFSRVRISSTLITTTATGSDEDTRSLGALNNAGEIEDYMTCVGCVDITGHVYDDVNGDSDMTDQVPVSGVSVYVYTDDGDGIPNAADGAPSYTTTTDANGYYSFLQIPGVTYFVSPNPPATGSAVADQTYTTTVTDNINGTFATGYCDANGDGVADATPISTTGSCFGGWDGDRATNNGTGNLSLREHITRIEFSGMSQAVNSLDFGFSYNVVTNLNNTAQGSLNQFITNANTIAGANEMRFVPAVPANDTDPSGDWWIISQSSSLTAISGVNGANTTIDGTVYSYTDGLTVIDSNTGNYSASQTVGSSIDCTPETIPPLAKPELQIDMATNASAYNAELLIISADNTTVKNLSLTGGSLGINVNAANITDTLIENNLIGIDPAGNDDVIGDQGCGTSLGCAGIAISNAGNSALTGDSGIIRNNAIKTAHNNISFNNLTSQTNVINWQVIHNQLLGTTSTAATPYHNIVIARGAPSYLNIQGNLLREATGDGINQSLTSAVDLNQTITSNDIQNAGGDAIHYQSGRNSVISCNLLHNNGGSGVSIDGNTNVRGYLITKNSFSNNDSNSIDLQNGATGDGVTINNDLCNNNSGAGANNNLARPEIDSAVYDGTNLTVTGSVCGTGEFVFEVYKVNAGTGDTGSDTKAAGEGETYLYTITGVVGSNLNDVTAVPGLVNGDEITVIAYRVTTGGLGALQDTSEFSANVPVDMDITLNGKVFEDNGKGATTAHNGIQAGSERGLHGFIVKAIYDDAAILGFNPGQEINRTITSGDGRFTLVIPVDLSEKDIKLIVVSQAAWIDISESDVNDPALGLVGKVTNNSLLDGEILINATAGDILDNLDFGKIQEPLLEPDNSVDALVGLPVFLRHKFIINTSGTVTFSLVNAQATPTGFNWSHILYQDISCNGVLDMPADSAVVAPFNMDADSSPEICLIVKSMMPANTPVNAISTYDLQADVTFSTSPVTRQLSDTDTIKVSYNGAGDLEIEKSVINITNASAESTSNTAKPNDILEYRIYFKNNGLGDVTDLIISDVVPDYTALSSVIVCTSPAASLPGSLTCDSIVTPNGTNTIGYNGGIEWHFTNVLAAGESGYISYQVKVE